MTHIDHIEPRWKEGRDYQLVCGLDCEDNFYVRDVSLNVRKSNYFLPWRVSPDEIGGVPILEGDLCQFLDPDTNEWVLEEFLGSWWFEKSSRFGCRKNSRNRTGQKHSPETIERMKVAQRKRFDEQPVKPETGRKISAARKGHVKSEETRRKQAESLRGHKRSPETIQRMKQSAQQRWDRVRLRKMSLSDPMCPDFED